MIDEFPEATIRYNLIPEGILKGKCLEIGAGIGERQVLSNYADFFRTGDYLGIDNLVTTTVNLPFIKADVFVIDFPEATFDVILAIEVVEHFSITLWPEFFDRVCKWLKPKGFLYITVPYNETARLYKKKWPCYSVHEVFGIKEKTIRVFLPDAKIQLHNHPYLLHGPDRSLLWRIGRCIKRVLTRHDFVKSRMTILWQKGDKQ